MMNEKCWFAVQKDCEDSEWGFGSYDYDEAYEMAVRNGCSQIAVIDESGNEPMCIDVIEIG